MKAEIIDKKVRKGEGAARHEFWDKMPYRVLGGGIDLPEIGCLEFDYKSFQYQPQHEVCYYLDLSIQTERWVAEQV